MSARRRELRHPGRRLVTGLLAAALSAVLVLAPSTSFSPSAAAAEVSAPDPQDSRAVYRFWSPAYGNAHFYTLDHSEAQNLHVKDSSWAYEGTDFRVWPVQNDVCSPGTVPVHRFWSSSFSSHFYTANSAEAQSIRTGDSSWAYEGVRFCTAPKGTKGTVAVHRFWSSTFKKHFYTANAAEAEKIRTGDKNWTYEGVAMYAPTSGPASAPITGPAAPRTGCQAAGMPDALAARDASRILAAFGGAAALRDAIAGGRASCVPLNDPALPWVVVNKHRPLDPADYAPPGLTVPSSSQVPGGLRTDAIDAFERLLHDSASAGAGRMTLASGYRSFGTQAAIHRNQVAALGPTAGEQLAARPGFSEHQLGLAADVAACGTSGCGSIYGFAGTSQQRWVAENSWRYGWIVRYEAGQTHVTGYQPEPWHLRYIGPELAGVYHDGGFRSLEAFFGLMPAPQYR
jgi:D-alanyl-D-alanine carboxypeptidase